METYEIAVLTPLPRLMAGAVAPEARLGALNVLLSILRERGEKITSGWRVVLSTLAAAANAPPAEGAVSLGWSAVSVVVSDLLPHVPDGVLTEVTTTVAAYARQRHDLGTSLTAVGALWNASDFFGQRVEEMRSPQAGAFMAEMTIVPLFSALRDASVDPRPEVRNSGVRTLVNTLTSHGGKLAPRAWRDCLWHVFFPLLDEIRARAAAASDEEQDATVGSKDGERVVMLVHHSRNTASKQWDETLTLSLGGVGKLARALPRRRVARRFRRTMGRLPRFFRPLRRERRQGDIPRRHLRVTDDHLVARVHAGDAPRALLAMSSSVRRRVARV